jgi:hypothetical protein
MVEAGPKKGLPQPSSGPQPQQRRSHERRRQLAKLLFGSSKSVD